MNVTINISNFSISNYTSSFPVFLQSISKLFRMKFLKKILRVLAETLLRLNRARAMLQAIYLESVKMRHVLPELSEHLHEYHSTLRKSWSEQMSYLNLCRARYHTLKRQLNEDIEAETPIDVTSMQVCMVTFDLMPNWDWVSFLQRNDYENNDAVSEHDPNE